MRLVDKFLPARDFSKSNKVRLNPQHLPDIAIIKRIDFRKSLIIKVLFFLRGLPSKKVNIEDFLSIGFVLLDQNPQEIVLGLVAQPWKFKGNIRPVSPESFVQFNDPDYVKVAWDFRYEQKAQGMFLTTETRIYCTSAAARKKFSIYWFLIGFFSGIIRTEMLRIIKKSLR